MESKGWLPWGVFVDREFTQEIKNQQTLLCPILKLARSIEEYKGKCKLVDDHRVIHGIKYYTSDVHKLPSNLSGFHTSSKMDDDGTVLTFFGELNPLSNFHPATFKVNRQTYVSSEQFIQELKTLFFKDEGTATQIMLSESSLECKELGRNIQNAKEDVWKKKAKGICYPGVLAKFQQNQHLKGMLKSTGNADLVEASYNRIWGTRIPLKDRDCLNKTNWYGTGILGEMLMEVRQELFNSNTESMDTTDTIESTSNTTHPPVPVPVVTRVLWKHNTTAYPRYTTDGNTSMPLLVVTLHV